MIILETERTIIREFNRADTNPMFDIYSNREVMRYIGDGKGFTLDETAIFIDKMILRYKRDGYSFWLVERKSDGEVLGHCGIMLEGSTGLIEIGYTINRPYWGQGYAFETSMAVLDYAFNILGLDQIVAHAKVKNKRSQEMMKKLGMGFWKTYTRKQIEYITYRIGRIE